MPWETPPHTILSGNTAGTTNIHGPVATFVASDNITLSGSGNRIVFMGAAGGTGAVAGPAIAAGTQTATASTVVFSNSNNVTFGMSGSTRVTASASFPAQTQFVLSASNGLAFGTNGSTVTGSYTVPVQSVQPAINLAAGTQTATSGTVKFVDSNGIVFGMSASTRITASYTVPTQSVQPGIQTIHAGLADITNGAFSFLDGNGITFGAESDLSQFTASVQTAYRGLTDAVGLNTAKSNVTWTVNSSGISLDARGYAGTTTAATSAGLTVDSGGVRVSVGPYITTARASTDAIGLNTAQSNVTWTANSSGLSLDARGYAGTVTGATNASVTANSAGVSVAVGNGVTATGNLGGIAVNAATTYTSGTVVFSNSNGVTFGTNAQTITASVVAPSVSYWENPRVDGLASWSGTSNSISVQRIVIPLQISATRADFILNISGSSSGALSLRVNLGLYTGGASTLNSASTTSRGFTFQSTSGQSYTNWSGPRSISIALGTWNMTPGEYFLAANFGWTTASTNTVSLNMYGNSSFVVSGAESGALGNVTNFFRSGMINNNAQSTLPNTMQLSGMTQTGAAAAQQPWFGFHGTF